MCNPLLIMGGLGAFQAVQTMGAGFAQAQGHKNNAYQYETQRIENRTKTSQASRDRWQKFTDLVATNSVAVALSGLSGDSFAAPMAEDRRRAGQDVDRIRMQGDIEDASLRYAAAQERSQARTARRQGIFGGLFSLANTAMSIGMLAPGGAGLFGGGTAAAKASSTSVKPWSLASLGG